MASHLFADQIDSFLEKTMLLFSGVPYSLHFSEEKYYHGLFHLILSTLGMHPQSEVQTNQGRIDLVIKTSQSVFIFEFKFDKTSQEAYDQIFEKKYYEKYLSGDRKIFAIGACFDKKSRNLNPSWIIKDVREVLKTENGNV